MRICLVFPPFSSLRLSAPPVELAVLAAVLRAGGHEVAVHDANITLLHRWVQGEPPRLLDYDPWLGIGRRLPAEMVAARPTVREAATGLSVPMPVDDPAAFAAVSRDVRALALLAGSLLEGYTPLLGQIIEGRRVADDALVNELFGHALALLDEPVDAIVMVVAEPVQLDHALAMARVLRPRTDVPLILVGMQLAAGVDAVELVAAIDAIDYAVVGDAEAGLPPLLDALGDGAPDSDALRAMPGVLHRSSLPEACDPLTPPEMALVDDPDTLPAPDYAGLDAADYLAPVPVRRVRATFGRRFDDAIGILPAAPWRERAVEAVAAEMAAVAGAGAGAVVLTGQITGDWLNALAEALTTRGGPVPFAADCVLPGPEMAAPGAMAAAYNAGLRAMGVMTGPTADHLRDMLPGASTADDALAAVAAADAAGVTAFLRFISGLPGQTPEEAGADVGRFMAWPGEPESFECVTGSAGTLNAEALGLHIEERHARYVLPAADNDPTTAPHLIHSPSFYWTAPGNSGEVGMAVRAVANHVMPHVRATLNFDQAAALATTGYFDEADGPVPPDDRPAGEDGPVDPARRQLIGAVGLFNTAPRPAAMKAFELRVQQLRDVQQGRDKRNLTDLEQAEHDLALILLGACRLDTGDPDGAQKQFGKVDRHSAFWPLARFWMAKTALDKRDYAGLHRPLEDAMRAGLNPPDAYLMLALGRVNRQPDATAIDLVEVALALQPRHFHLNELASTVAQQLGQTARHRAHKKAFARKQKQMTGADPEATIDRVMRAALDAAARESGTEADPS